jgi:ketosteroid isomerase-like protein
MAREDVKVVRLFYESWNRGDTEAALECLAADVRIDWSNSRSPFSGIYEGRESFDRFWTEIRETWDQFTLEIRDVVECGRGRVVAETGVSGRGKGSGIEIAAAGAMLWTVRDGRIRAGTLFQTRREAVEAARANEG